MRWFHIEGFSDLRSVRPVGWTVTSRSQKATTRLAGLFKKKILFSGKLRLGSNLKIQRKKWTGAFCVDIILPFEL
jgi:neutral trehalase